VLSTHDPDQAFLCADLVALLREGRLARLGPTAEVITSATLREAYGVDVEVVTLTREGCSVRVCLPSLERRPD
jgi:iron complex transport system ATP-binding protein